MQSEWIINTKKIRELYNKQWKEEEKYNYIRMGIICHIEVWLMGLDYHINIKYLYPVPLDNYVVANDLKMILFLHSRGHLHSRKGSPSFEISSPNTGNGHKNAVS